MQTHRQRLQSRFGLETASDGSGSVNTTTPHYARGFAEKKGDTEEEAEAKKKKVTGTTVTTLPAADLRFLKLRRRPDSECNVPITFDRDEKLREMFTRLDHEGRGFIYLKELKEASEFVEKRMKATKELVRANGAKSLYQVFQDMDTNHDGFLTNNEFVNAMTGTRRGAFENLSEDDIEQVRDEEGERVTASVNVLTFTPASSCLHDSPRHPSHRHTLFFFFFCAGQVSLRALWGPQETRSGRQIAGHHAPADHPRLEHALPQRRQRRRWCRCQHKNEKPGEADRGRPRGGQPGAGPCAGGARRQRFSRAQGRRLAVRRPHWPPRQVTNRRRRQPVQFITPCRFLRRHLPP